MPESNRKKAFVLDTNFIIQYKEMDKVIMQLEDRFTVYVSQFTIEERVAQQFRDVRTKCSKLDELAKDLIGIVHVETTYKQEDLINHIKDGVQRTYDTAFGNNIIPFHTDESVLERIISRAHLRVPPFHPNDDASDKGFKDTVIWLSLLDFFKQQGEDEVLFVTNWSAPSLCANQ